MARPGEVPGNVRANVRANVPGDLRDGAVSRGGEAERRLAAILAADVVGFSRMMGTDEAGALAGLERARRLVVDPAIAGNRGRIFKVMGDGLLAEFPSSMLALRAAVAIQDALPGHNAGAPRGQAVVLRIGLHQGDVLVQGGDLLGDGVNIAARLEPLAPAGGVCVSARVREDAAGKVVLPFEDGGERVLKNIARPVRVFFLRPARATAVGVPGPVAAGEDDWQGETTLFVQGPGHRHSLVVVVSAFSGLVPGHAVPLSPEPLVLGRQAPSGLLLPGGEVSRVHCRVELAEGGVLVTDLRSTNGTFVDNRRIGEPVRLGDGATLRVGPYVLRYVLEAADADADATRVVRG